jgi:drug/metabolite transporter (DMT)-like permease
MSAAATDSGGGGGAEAATGESAPLLGSPSSPPALPDLLFGIPRDTVLSTCCYSFCSGTMLVVNKLVAYHIPAPAFIASVQIVVCICLVLGAHVAGRVAVEPMTRGRVLPYAYYSILFAGSLFTNIHALKHSNVETVIVFRAATPVAVAIADAAFLGRELPDQRSAGALATIVAGVYLYVIADAQFAMESFWAYHWVGLYFIIIVVEMTYGKKIVRDVKLSLSGSVAYSNGLSLPVMLVLMLSSGELGTLTAPGFVVTLPGLCWLILSCIVGTGISYAGWWCRSCVSVRFVSREKTSNRVLHSI